MECETLSFFYHNTRIGIRYPSLSLLAGQLKSQEGPLRSPCGEVKCHGGSTPCTWTFELPCIAGI